MGFLTDRTLATGVTLDDLIHIVNTSDLSQGNPAGSSYKAKVSQVGNTFSSLFVNQSGDTMTGTLIVPTISATTYQNLPVGSDTYVTGYTYSNNTFTIKQNNGQPDLTSTINIVTGWTVNGYTTLSGLTTVYGDTPVSAAITPGVNNSYDLGQPSFRWREIWTTNISCSNVISSFSMYATYNAGVGNDLTVSGNTSLQSTTASTLNISSTPTTDTNLSANYLTRDSTTGEVKVKTIPGPTV